VNTSLVYHNEGEKKLPILVAHNVRSILNVGALFRTADALGFGAVYLCGYTPGPDTHSEKMMKTALGAQDSVAWKRWGGELGELSVQLRKQGYAVVALEQHETAQDVGEVQISQPLALVVGNEVEGLVMSHNQEFTTSVISQIPDRLCNVCGTSHNLSPFCEVVHIPMLGKKESLNVAIAFGIAGYQLLHGRPSNNS
jgi:tRNA G18 (ribose-2'-O)-methylase SpoU